MNGIDISNWQNGINLAAVPFDFVICKATEGAHYVSPDCDRQIQQAIGLGKLVGVYHYVNGGDAKAEAEYFYEHCKGYVGKAAFFIDWEDKGNKAWGDASYLKAMAERLAGLLGVGMDRIGIYASKSVFPWNLTTAKTWVAQYADMNPTGYQDEPWNEEAYDCAIRQYSSCGRLDGWAGNLDINKCYISRTEWEAMAGGSNGDPSSLIHGIDETPTADLAAKVLAGEFGDGDDRKHALDDRYSEVQALVNHILTASAEDLAAETWAGDYGNGSRRKAVLGPRYDEVMAIINGQTETEQVYVVQGGDTLSAIASKYGTTYQDLAAKNGISNPNLIYPGMRLVVS